MRENPMVSGASERAARDASLEAAEPWVVSLGVPSTPALRLLDGLVPCAHRLVVVDERAARGRRLPGVPFDNLVVAPSRAGSALRVLLALARLAPRVPRAAVLLLWHPEGTQVPLEPARPALRQAFMRAAAGPHELFLLARRGEGEGAGASWARLGPRLANGAFLADALEVRPPRGRLARLVAQGAVPTRPLLVGGDGALLEALEATLGVPHELVTELGTDGEAGLAGGSWLVRGLYEATPPADLERDVLASSPERLRVIVDEPDVVSRWRA